MRRTHSSRACARQSGLAAAAVVASLLLSAPAGPDRIKVGDVQYEDVLIYRSSSMYYVKVPEEGIIFNVRAADIDEGGVEIDLDPYYRDELKIRFEEVVSGERVPVRHDTVKSAFGSAPEGGAAPAPPMSLEEALELGGLVVSKEGGDTVAKSGDGTITLRIKGGEVAQGVSLLATMPPAQIMQLGAKLAPALEHIGAVAPWAGDWTGQNILPLIQNGGSAEHTEDGYHIEFTIEKTETDITVRMEFQPAT